MRSVQNFLKGCVIVLAFALMGQAQNCGDLKTLLPDIDKIWAKPAGSKIYISNLSFMDADTKTTMPAGDAEQINQAVEEGMKMLASTDPKYAINEPGRTLPNTDASAQKLSAIYWDQNLSRTDKVDKIINEMMTPAQIDGLVAGQFQEAKDGTITVRPFVISKQSKQLVTETKKFTKQEFSCTDKNNPNRKVLCEKTREEIRDVVVRLLKTL